MSKLPFEGLKVLELAQMVAGPYCAKLLADYGAQVIKVERAPAGDAARSIGPFADDVPHPDRSLLFLYLNTNKSSVTLNIEVPTGRELFRRLVGWADVLVEDTPPGYLASLGLDVSSLRRTNPQLLVTSVTPFGQTGPYRSYKAYPLNTFHAGSEGYVVPGGKQYLGRPPLKVGGYVGEYSCGMSAAIATVAAVYARQRGGVACWVDMSKQETLMHHMKQELAGFLNEGVLPTRANQIHPHRAVVPCKNGHVELHLFGDDRHWQDFVAMMGHPGWVHDEKFKDREGRALHKEELVRNVMGWTLLHTKEEIAEEGQARHIPIAPYNSPREVLASPQLQARRFFLEAEHPVAGKIMYPTTSFKFSGLEWSLRSHAPKLGEHNASVFCGLLGYPQQKLVAWRETKVI